MLQHQHTVRATRRFSRRQVPAHETQTQQPQAWRDSVPDLNASCELTQPAHHQVIITVNTTTHHCAPEAVLLYVTYPMEAVWHCHWQSPCNFLLPAVLPWYGGPTIPTRSCVCTLMRAVRCWYGSLRHQCTLCVTLHATGPSYAVAGSTTARIRHGVVQALPAATACLQQLKGCRCTSEQA